MKLLAIIASALCLLLIAGSFAWSGTISVVGELSRETTLGPGDKTQGKILVRNNSDAPQQVKVYQNDYLFYADGRNIYGEPGSVARSNARWIAFTPNLFTIPAKESIAVGYLLQVPDDKSLTGSYWSMLMVEPVVESSLDPDKLRKATVSITTVLRYAVQIVTQIGQTGTRSMEFTDKQLVVAEGKKTLQLDAENTGESWLRPTVWAEIFDREGTALGRFEGGRMRIYPGCSVRLRIDLSALPPGEYSALIVGDNGDEHVFGAQYQLSIR